MNAWVSLSPFPRAHPPRSNPALRSSSDAWPFPCITPSTVTWVMVVSFMSAAPYQAPPLVGGLTPATNTTAPIRHRLPDFFEELSATPVVSDPTARQFHGDRAPPPQARPARTGSWTRSIAKTLTSRPHMPLPACWCSSQPVRHRDVWLSFLLRVPAGLRIFEACGASIVDLGEEHGHHVLGAGQGRQDGPCPAAPAVAWAIDRAVDGRTAGPILRNTPGARMDRHAATRRLKHLAATAGVRMPRMHPHAASHVRDDDARRRREPARRADRRAS